MELQAIIEVALEQVAWKFANSSHLAPIAPLTFVHDRRCPKLI
jgi:hypothetical protein